MTNEVTKRMIKFGEKYFNGKIDITDPCYDTTVWCRINNVEVEPGIYNCYALITKGDRVAQLSIVKKDHLNKITSWDVLDGVVGVDSGLAGFFDSNLPKINLSREILRNEEDICWLIEDGFFSESGWGDGGYQVEALKNKEGKTVGLKLHFIEEEDEEEDDE